MILDVTPDHLRDACREIYEPGQYRHAPAQVFIDHYGDTTYLRCSFPERFTHAAACKLDALRDRLRSLHGEADIVFVVYFDVIDVMDMARHSVGLQDR